MQRMAVEREKEREEHELRMAEQRAAANAGNNSTLASTVKAPKLKLNSFKETDRIEIFISRFEEAAEYMKFDDDAKRVQFMSLFEGKALEVIHRLDENAREYKDMKEALLAAYGMSVDDLKRQFFSATLGEDETAIQFAARLKGYFNQWLSKDGAEETVEGIKDLIVRSVFIKSCPEELVAKLKMDKTNTLDVMKETANSYFEANSRKKRPVKSAPSESPASGKVVQANGQSAGAISRPHYQPRNSHAFPPRYKPVTYGPRVNQGNYAHPRWNKGAAVVHEPWSQRRNYEGRQTAHAPIQPSVSHNYHGVQPPQ